MRRCLAECRRDWERALRGFSDEKIEHKLTVTEPSWDCGDDKWRLWKRLVRQEAHRRGLGT
jgi:hypothetical protein